ncbi:exo-alpha-sialidase [Candidatus Uabimicrobium amorphum]|nr:sialidase family protein [Candidatus Uabimicrobium amorphum]
MKTKIKYELIYKIICVIFCYAMAFFTSPTTWQDREITKPKSHTKKDPVFSAKLIAPEFSQKKNHVSSITALDEKRQMCVWYAGSEEGAADVEIYAAIKEDGVWSSPQSILDLSTSSTELQRYIRKVGNAVVFKDANNVLWLFYCTVPIGGWSMARTNYRYSHDNGKTWSKSKELLLNPFLSLSNNVKNKPLLFADGSFLLPLYQEFINKYGLVLWGKLHEGEFKYMVRRISHKYKCLQPTLVHRQNRTIDAYCRNRDKGQMLHMESSDLGISWSAVNEGNLPNPNSGFDMLHIAAQEYVGIINYSPKERDNLVVVHTQNAGKKWNVLHYLENPIPKEQDERFKAIGKMGHYYQYPAIIEQEGNYHLTYTCFNKIKYTTFNSAWLNKKLQEVTKQ